jgi:hypothetical protein
VDARHHYARKLLEHALIDLVGCTNTDTEMLPKAIATPDPFTSIAFAEYEHIDYSHEVFIALITPDANQDAVITELIRSRN